MDPSVLVRVLSQRYGITPQEYVNTRTFDDFMRDAIGWYSEVLAPIAAVAEALGGNGETSSTPSNSTPTAPKRNPNALPPWIKPKGNYTVHRLGKSGEPIPEETKKALRKAARSLGR